MSLVPDIVSFGAKPNTTAVSLQSEETTKVPFTLTNLGSRGSFSFHVTKTSSLISYVIPFSLALDANASAAGHVVISSRSDTSQPEKLTVTAVAQSDTVNIKEVTLFDIHVSVLSESQPTTPALKQIRLEAVAPNSHQSIKPGERLELNFTVTNLAAVENFTFNVSFFDADGSSVLSFLLGLTMKFFMYVSPCGGGGTPIYKIDGDATLKRYQVSVLWAWLECFSPQNYQFLRNTRSAVIC